MGNKRGPLAYVSTGHGVRFSDNPPPYVSWSGPTIARIPIPDLRRSWRQCLNECRGIELSPAATEEIGRIARGYVRRRMIEIHALGVHELKPWLRQVGRTAIKLLDKVGDPSGPWEGSLNQAGCERLARAPGSAPEFDRDEVCKILADLALRAHLVIKQISSSHRPRRPPWEFFIGELIGVWRGTTGKLPTAGKSSEPKSAFVGMVKIISEKVLPAGYAEHTHSDEARAKAVADELARFRTIAANSRI